MKRARLNLDLTSVIVMIAAGVLLPVLLSTAVGIVALVAAENTTGIVTGVLIISFTVTAAGCGLLALVFAGRKARLARQQADFIANISHELRTPLSAIRLYAHTLHSGKLRDDPKETERCIATILRETSWLDVMIERVLTWRASSKDMMELSVETRPVSKAVRGAMDRFASLVPPGEVTLSCSIETSQCVRHDGEALSTVVLNLLTNAYKYTGSRKEISVGVEGRDGRVVIDVKDNGIGLSPTEARQIFKPFYRVERGEASRTGGIGLGLAIARKLVIRHGGSISVSSEKHKGSSFTISLPALEGES
jgi:signal transduction histidine kinase